MHNCWCCFVWDSHKFSQNHFSHERRVLFKNLIGINLTHLLHLLKKYVVSIDDYFQTKSEMLTCPNHGANYKEFKRLYSVINAVERTKIPYGLDGLILDIVTHSFLGGLDIMIGLVGVRYSFATALYYKPHTTFQNFTLPKSINT